MRLFENKLVSVKALVFWVIWIIPFLLTPSVFSQDFTERSTITIAGATSTLTDYQVKITVPFVSGMRSDYGDLRFGDAGGTFFSYWVERFTDAEAVVWVKVPSIPPDGATIYVYYGNPSVTSASSGFETFEFFDDFDGASLDTGRWISDGTPVVAEGAINLNDAGDWIQTANSFSSSYRIHGKIYTGSPNNFHCVLGFGGHDPAGEWQFADVDGAYIYWEFGGNKQYTVRARRGNRSWVETYPAEEWHVWELYIDESSGTAYGAVDDSTFASSAPGQAISLTRDIFFGRHQNAPGVADFKADWIFVRKHNATLEAGDIAEVPTSIADQDDGVLGAASDSMLWASSVVSFTTQYADDNWSAQRALGTPDTYPNYGDINTAWASRSGDGQREALELGYTPAVSIQGVDIYETYNPGAIDSVMARDPNGDLHLLWSGEAAPAPAEARIFEIRFDPTSFLVQSIRLAINSPAVSGWNEIDAVGIIPAGAVVDAGTGVPAVGEGDTAGGDTGTAQPADTEVAEASETGAGDAADSGEGTGTITTVAGTGVQEYSGDDIEAIESGLKYPFSIYVDHQGNLYIAEELGDRVRRVDGQTGIMTTVAGNGTRGFSGDGGPATQAQLNSPIGIAVDAANNLFIASYGHRVRRVDGQTGVITTIAGDGTAGFSGDGTLATQAQLSDPLGVFVDGDGNLLISDTENHRIRRVDGQTGIITTIAGNGTRGFSGDGGPATQAQLNNPIGIHADSAGNLYIVDTENHRVRHVDGQTGIITTIAGTGEQGFSGDEGPSTQAQLKLPIGIFVDAGGNLFIGTWNHRVRRVDGQTGVITTIAGDGTADFFGDGGPATQAQLNGPRGVFVDSQGNLFISDSNNNRIRRVENIAAPTVLEVDTVDFAGAGDIYAPEVANSSPQNGAVDIDPVAINADGIAISFSEAVDADNVQISFQAGGQILTWQSAWSEDRTQLTLTPATGHELIRGMEYLLTLSGVADQQGNATDEIALTFSTRAAIITTIAGTGRSFDEGILPTQAHFNSPRGIFVDPAGNVFIAVSENNRIRRIDSQTGLLSTVAGVRNPGFSGDGGPAIEAQFQLPEDILIDAAGNLLIADSGNNRIRRVDGQTGIVSTVAGIGELGYSGDGGPAIRAQFGAPTSIFLDAAGNLYISDRANHSVRRIDGQTGVISTVAGTGTAGFSGDGGPATEAMLSIPNGIFIDGDGNLWIADSANHRIRRVDMQTGIIATVVGTGEAGYSGDGGPSVQAQIRSPRDVFVDAAGNLFIADSANHRIRRVNSHTGIIITVAGTGELKTGGNEGDGGPANQARLFEPSRIFVDSVGNLYIADSNAIRRVEGIADSTIIEGGVFEPAGEAAVEDATVSSTAPPSGSLDKTKIAFESDRDGNPEIYVMDIDGSNIIRLTNHKAEDRSPSWSPDGTKIAFCSDRTGNGDIYVMNVNGTNPVRLTDRNALDCFPSWSPDGAKIAFWSDRNDNARAEDYESSIYAMNADGSNPIRIVDTIISSFISWSPDGSQIVYNRKFGFFELEIFAVNSDGTNLLQLTQNGDSDSDPAWSPDGTKIAYRSHQDLFVMNADGTNPMQLYRGDGSSSYPSWSPDGTKIAYSFYSNIDRNSAIYVMNADGSDPVRLISDTYINIKSAWSPLLDESIIASIESLNATPSTGTALSTTSPPDGATDVDPTALEVDGVILTFAEPIDAKKARVNVSAGGSWDAVWSADGTRLTLRPADVFALAFQTAYEVELTTLESTGGTVFQDVSLAFTTSVAPQIALWAGDTNDDGAVDAKDVIPIGVFWNASGTARTDRSTDWQELETTSWISARATRADANGDGRVNQSDIDPIVDNWNSTRGGAGKASAPRAKALRQLLAALEHTDADGPFGALKTYVAAQLGTPDDYALTPSRPNPFNASTVFEVRLPAPETVRLTIYNIRGQAVRTLVAGHLPAGFHTFSWDGRDDSGRDLSSGVYLYQVRSDQFNAVRRMALIH